MSATRSRLRAVLVASDPRRAAHLAAVLEVDLTIAVVAQVAPASATATIIDVRPGVVVMVSSPDAPGQALVEEIMTLAPTPILVIADGPDLGHPRAVSNALAAGAADAFIVPAQWTPELALSLRHSAHQLSKVHVVRRARRAAPAGAGAAIDHRSLALLQNRPPVVALAASTGGPSALATILAGLHGLAAPVLVVQHLHPDFDTGLVEWMSRVSALPVKTAADGELARPGQVYVSPGGVHLRLAAHGHLELDPQPRSIHRPSADELFASVAERAGAAGIGVLLTGMGEDGARGLLSLRTSGGMTMAQDEETCVVFGMPRAAHRLGAVVKLVPLPQIANAIQRAVAAVAR